MGKRALWELGVVQGAGGTEPGRGTGGKRGRMGKRALWELGGGARGRRD